MTNPFALSFRGILGLLVRLIAGEPVTFTALLYVVLETCFAAPGLIALSPPRVVEQPLLLFSLYAAAGLAASLNVLLALGEAKEELMWERAAAEVEQRNCEQRQALRRSPEYQKRTAELQQERRERSRRVNDIETRLGRAHEKLKGLERNVERHAALMVDIKERARLEYSSFIDALDGWLNANSEVVERFLEQQSAKRERESERNGHQNGHRQSSPIQAAPNGHD